jgi:hypothetical protein
VVPLPFPVLSLAAGWARVETKKEFGGFMKKLASVALVAMLSLAASLTASAETSLPAGTAVKIKLESTLATFSSKQGDTFSGRVTEPVSLAGKMIIPVGATVQGTVGRVAEPRRVQGRPTIALFPHTVILPDGTRFNLSATVVDTNLHNGTDINEEGQFKGKARDGGDNVELAAGTAGGGLIGALAGGGKGFLVGAAIGAGATTIHWLTKHHSAILPAGTELVMELNRPMEMSAAVNNGE